MNAGPLARWVVSLPYRAETARWNRRLLETRQADFFNVTLRTWPHRIRKRQTLPQTESDSFELFFFPRIIICTMILLFLDRALG